MAQSPFLASDFHIRWSELSPEHVGPDIGAAVTEAQAAVDTIADMSLDALTCSNTFLALDRTTEKLTVAWGKVTHLQAVADSPALREAHNAMLPLVYAFYASIPLNSTRWERLRTFAASPRAAELRGIERRFLDETVKDFI